MGKLNVEKSRNMNYHIFRDLEPTDLFMWQGMVMLKVKVSDTGGSVVT